MKTRYLIIIGPSGSGKSILSNTLVKDFPDIFYFKDIDKHIKYLKNVTFETHYDYMFKSFNDMDQTVDINKIIISDSISDLFIKFDKIISYKKIYIHEKFLDKERHNFMTSGIFSGYADCVNNWNSKYNSKEDFIYNRENYEELKRWLNENVF